MLLKYMLRKLSPRQQQVYDFIKEYHLQNGFSPSLADVADGVGLAVSTVATYVKLVKAKGYITSKEGIPRSLKIILEPEQKRNSL